MQRLAVALLLGGVLLLASWVVAGDPPRRAATSERLPAPDQVSQLIADVNEQVELLRERLAIERRFARPNRDPFRFSASLAPAPVASPVVEAVSTPEPSPLPQLVAILTDTVETVVTRRAVFSVNGAVVIAKLGERVDRFDVARIDAAGVDLKERETSANFRLSIK